MTVGAAILLCLAFGWWCGYGVARRRYYRQEITIELAAAMNSAGLTVVNTVKYQALCHRLVALERELGLREYYEEH